MRNICRVTAQLWSRGLPRTNQRLFWGIELPPAFYTYLPCTDVNFGRSLSLFYFYSNLTFVENLDVHLYKFFSADRYVPLTAIDKNRIGCPKRARNEQVCAHQKVM